MIKYIIIATLISTFFYMYDDSISKDIRVEGIENNTIIDQNGDRYENISNESFELGEVCIVIIDNNKIIGK